ncbi:uncharacterized protein LOC134220937 isoform X2 [Armigeres subalbatus]|uniref:uncharacterized protein LOC134220937 isoform X2 n=1 Tax=Armigeres subalbatus TaxID=124917 RepID=UPI002ED5C85B
MASCYLFRWCFPNCFSNGIWRGDGQERSYKAVIGRNSSKAKQAKRNKKFRPDRMEKGSSPGQVSEMQQPTSVLKHWAGQSRCCEEVLEEIRLNAVDAPEATEDQAVVAGSAVLQDERNPLTRFKRFFIKKKTPQQIEMETLRNERKTVIKYLKGVGLYDRRMSYEMMLSLKSVVEMSLESEKQKEEIEMKELKSRVTATKLNPSPVVEIPKSEALNKISPTVELPNSPNVEQIESLQPESGKIEMRKPESLLGAVNSAKIHSAMGFPISAPIDMPGDIPCTECNPEAIVVQAGVQPNLMIDVEKMSLEDKKRYGTIAPPLPAKEDKPRIVGFMLKPGRAMEYLNAIGEEANSNLGDAVPIVEAGADFTSVDDDFTPKPLPDLCWTFGHT